MTTITHHRKTFADVSAMESFSGIGFIFGAFIGVGAALSDFAFPGFSAHPQDWALNFLIGGAAGAVIGGTIGAIADRVSRQRNPDA